MIKQKIYEQLSEHCRDKIKTNDCFRLNHSIALEQDCRKTFNLIKPGILEMFLVHTIIAKNLKNIPLKCELKLDPDSKRLIDLVSTNLLTDEVVDISKRTLGRLVIEDSDLYEFYSIPIMNPYDDPFQDDKCVNVITRPLESEGKKQKEITLDI